MKKSLFLVCMMLGLSLIIKAQPTGFGSSMVMPQRDAMALQPAPGQLSIEKGMMLKPVNKPAKTIKRAAEATAEDYIGKWMWKGGNDLSSEIMPNEGEMTVEANPSDPTRLTISGLPINAITLDAYVKDGRLYIPNQKATDNYGGYEMYFVNWSMIHADSPGMIYYVKNTATDFYFQLNEDGMLSAGMPGYELDEKLDSMTDEEMLENICIGSLTDLEESGFWWHCRFISATDERLEKNGITYYVIPGWNEAGAYNSDPEIEEAILENQVEIGGRSYNVVIIAPRCFQGRANMRNLTLSSTIRTIESEAFRGCINLKSVTIPNSVTSIESSAFANCDELEEFIIGENVAFLGPYMLSMCYKIKEIVVPNSVKTMDLAFYGCDGMEKITIGNSVEHISDYSFIACENLREVILGNSVTSIGYAAFSFCEKLSKINFPESLEEIGGWAFGNCLSLREVNLPASLRILDTSAFAYAEGLQNINIASGNPDCTSVDGVLYSKDCTELQLFPTGRTGTFRVPEFVSQIGPTAFYGSSRIKELELHDGIKEIGLAAFINCINLRSINIPAGITRVPAQCFQNAGTLTEIRMPDSVVAIDSLAFGACNSLTNIDLGAGLERIDVVAFNGCENISNIICRATTPPTAAADIFMNSIYGDARLYVVQNAFASYLDASPWNNFAKINAIGASITLSHTDVTLTSEEVFQLGVYGAVDKVTWTSSDPMVAYANECGLIVGRKPGSVTITASASGATANCNVTVTAAGGPSGVYGVNEDVIEPQSMVIESIGGNPPMVNLRLFPVGSKTVVDWSASDNSVATVEDGLVTIIGEGEVDITVETANGLIEVYDTDSELIDPSGVEQVIFNPEYANDIFTLQGVCIKHNATIDDVKALEPGLYIISGKKVLVK